jgi:hypothetical protein
MGLNHLDYAIIGLYLAGITLFGLRFRKKQRTLRDYFLAGRDIPCGRSRYRSSRRRPARSPSSVFRGWPTTPT